MRCLAAPVLLAALIGAMPVNLANHSYVNLAGQASGAATGEKLTIHAARWRKRGRTESRPGDWRRSRAPRSTSGGLMQSVSGATR